MSFSRPGSPLQLPNDSFVESQQCSADPSAFVGFHVSSSAEEVEIAQPKVQKEKKQSFKLVLDLNMSTGGVTRGSDGFRPVAANPFNELFAEDTQDNVNLMDRAPVGSKNTVLQVEKIQENSMLQSLETALQARKVKFAEKAANEEKITEDLVPGASGFSDYSEDLAPRIFDTALSAAKASDAQQKIDSSGIVESSDRETDDEDDMECTQPLEEDDDDADVTRNDGDGSVDDEAETEVFPYSGTGTLPYGVDSSYMDKIEEEESKDVAEDSFSGEKSVVVDQKRKQRTSEDEFTSGEGSQATQQDYLTPRVNPCRVEQFDSAERSSQSVIVDESRGKEKEDSEKEDSDDEPEECVPTQPSKPRTEDEPVVEPNSPPPSNVARKNVVVASDSQTKAIRSLEFSFSMPESQDGEPHFSASLTSEGTPAAKQIEAFSRDNRPSPFEASISPVYQATLTPVDDLAVPDAEPTVTATEAQVTTKRKIVSPLRSGVPRGNKKQKTLSEATNSPGQVASTPTPKKRKRGVFSPEGSRSVKESDVSVKESDVSNPQTPRPPARRSTRSAQSTPSSTPQVRTRARNLTPVPLQRMYASRTRAQTLFKYKFEFCLTGFVNTGVESLKEYIKAHGGKIPERYEDVLYKSNPKAVVIATPVSWRKRKFMKAVACGIPVVHTDWIKGCVDAGYVLPFDGYQVPTGYSVTTRKSECFPPTQLHIFEGYSFGIASDVSQTPKSEAKENRSLITFILKACGADAVYEDLSNKTDVSVDIVLCDEYTPICRYYKRKRHVPVKNFQWVTECMILQKMLDPEDPVFEPQRVGSEDVSTAIAEIGDSDKSTLKLYTGELVMADISGSVADHCLLFNVCEILSIHVSARRDEDSQSKQKVQLRVGMLKREPCSPELSTTPVKVLDISSSQVKRRVVAISKSDYAMLKYKDESIFCLEDDSEPDNVAVSTEHRWLTQ